MALPGLLSESTAWRPPSISEGDPAIDDLHLDQVAEQAAAGYRAKELIRRVLLTRADSKATIQWRHEVFSDLEDASLLDKLTKALEGFGEVHQHWSESQLMRMEWQQQGWMLDAVDIYCRTVQDLHRHLQGLGLESRALRSFRDYLASYVASATFAGLLRDTSERKHELSSIRYCLHIDGPQVDVSRYEGQPDHRDEIVAIFQRFNHDPVRDYRVDYRTGPGMNHVQEQILLRVVELFPGPFARLDSFCRQHSSFFDRGIRRFEEEIQFFLSFLDYIRPMRNAGLKFCLPEIDEDTHDVSAADAFDLALAAKLVPRGQQVVTNDYALLGSERILVISGPNQGGKTTMARMFGQLHHLGCVGCPVPGTQVRVHFFDRLYTQFERAEDPTKTLGKLEEDLLRIQAVLREATPHSVVIMNELFTSTTLTDAGYLGKKVLAKVVQLGLLGVYVTFLDEMASFDPSVVSMVASVDPANPAERTMKVVRGPADGRAYALAIADKHGLSYEDVMKRVPE